MVSSTGWATGGINVNIRAAITMVSRVPPTIVDSVVIGHFPSTSSSVDQCAEEAFVSASGSTDEEGDLRKAAL